MTVRQPPARSQNTDCNGLVIQHAYKTKESLWVAMSAPPTIRAKEEMERRHQERLEGHIYGQMV